MLTARMSSRHFFETGMVYAFSWAIARSRGLGLENRAKGSAVPGSPSRGIGRRQTNIISEVSRPGISGFRHNDFGPNGVSIGTL